MTDEPVSISAASLQTSTDHAWEPEVDKIMGFLRTSITEDSEAGFYETSFSVWNISQDDENKIGNPGGGCMINSFQEEMLWLMLFARLKDSGLRVRHEKDSEVCFYWGDTPEKCGLTTLEFACLRVL